MESNFGILLCNLGSPRSPSVEDVREYLDEFLNDPYVINLPWMLRKILVNGIILRKRPKNSAEAYAKIWRPEGSPLIIHTRSLAQKLERAMNVPVEMGMRYGTPSIQSSVKRLVDRGVKKIIFLPLYPQYSYAASETAIVEFEKAMKDFHEISFRIIEDFYDHPAFVSALSESIRAEVRAFKPDVLLLSYHGVPQNQLTITRNQRNYREQCYATSEFLKKNVGLSNEQLMTTSQSRLGPTKWIEPYTDILLPELPKKGVKRLLVASPSFTADCLETLEEIDIRYRELFLRSGGVEFKYIPCLNDSDQFVSAIQKMIGDSKINEIHSSFA